MKRYICIHGHFYQPPRENPWLEDVELQDSAYPYHDWNERIIAECYAPNTASRILDASERIVDIVNNYSRISYDFGPTLLSWIEKHKPDIYEAIIAADRLSMDKFHGHGSALAQVYNHMIMPLANRRDKYTQVIWGINDFHNRFGRLPEGMWLAETAVDLETLEIMAELGIRFTILAPHQAKRVRKIGDKQWIDFSNGGVDPTMPYVCNLPSEKSIVLFFYDGPISQDIAFGGLLKSGEAFANRLISAYADHRDWPQMVHIATDGETYGHHQRSGDMALAYCLYHIESKNLAKLTNYGAYLEMYSPRYEAEIIEDSSWSCIHGIERWKENCGCNTGMHGQWSQNWRNPLRNALDWLRDRLARYFEEETLRFLQDPWHARNDYIQIVLNRDKINIDAFFTYHCVRKLSEQEKGRVLKLLELQRNAMLMYTSCGWFFDEISGIETIQVLQYAAQAIQYLKELTGTDIEPEFEQMLEKAPSNVFASGLEAYKKFVKPARIDLYRVGAHYAISSIFEEYTEDVRIFSFAGKSEFYDRKEAGRIKLVTGVAKIISDITWDEKILTFSVLNLGDQNINCGIRDFVGVGTYKEMNRELNEAFDRGDIPDVIRRMDRHFGTHSFTLWHLFRDEQRKVIDQILTLTYEGIEASYRQIYENNYTIMNFFHTIEVRLPRPLLVAAEYVINSDLRRIFEGEIDLEKLEKLSNEVKKWSLVIDKAAIGYAASEKINELMENLLKEQENTVLIRDIEETIRLLRTLPIDLDLWKAQNIYFSVGKSQYNKALELSEREGGEARKWVESFRKLGYYIQVKVT